MDLSPGTGVLRASPGGHLSRGETEALGIEGMTVPIARGLRAPQIAIREVIAILATLPGERGEGQQSGLALIARVLGLTVLGGAVGMGGKGTLPVTGARHNGGRTGKIRKVEPFVMYVGSSGRTMMAGISVCPEPAEAGRAETGILSILLLRAMRVKPTAAGGSILSLCGKGRRRSLTVSLS